MSLGRSAMSSGPEPLKLYATIRGLESMLNDTISGLLRIRDEAETFEGARTVAAEALREIGMEVDDD